MTAHGGKGKPYAVVFGKGLADVFKVRASHEEFLMRLQDCGLFCADDEGDDGALQVARKGLALLLVHRIGLCVDIFHIHRSWRGALAAIFRVRRLYDLDGIVGFLHLDVALRAGNLVVGFVILVGRHCGCGRGGARGRIGAQEIGSSFGNAGWSC